MDCTYLNPICAFRSLTLSFHVLVPEEPGYDAGFFSMISARPSSSNLPPSTSLKDRNEAPSCQISLECGGMEPAEMPPMSAW
ncbi:hypothetical protein CaCOL14_011732 [Colletotrichum acutatum]